MKRLWHRVAEATLAVAWFVTVIGGIVLVFNQFSALVRRDSAIDTTALLAGVCILLSAFPAHIGIKTLRARWRLDEPLPDPVSAIRERAYADHPAMRLRPLTPAARSSSDSPWPRLIVRAIAWLSIGVLVFEGLLVALDTRGTWHDWARLGALIVVWFAVYRIALRRWFATGDQRRSLA